MRLITICVCTYNRPLLLERLLSSISRLRTDGEFTHSVVVIDNDVQETARAVVLRAKKTVNIDIDYCVEPVRSISLARNSSVRMSKGELIAFIDDDEYPDENWLLFHYRALMSSGSDGVLGPVLPHFDSPPPPWLLKSGLLDRKRFPTNTLMVESRNLRTGNALLWKRIFFEGEKGFDPKYGRSGGEDTVFFRNKIEEGKRFIWCDEACVYEAVPPERQKLSYYIKRALTRGMATAWNTPFMSTRTIVSFLAILIYTFSLPLSICIGRHFFAKILIKDCDHIAKILSYAGIKLVEERPH